MSSFLNSPFFASKSYLKLMKQVEFWSVIVFSISAFIFLIRNYSQPNIPLEAFFNVPIACLFNVFLFSLFSANNNFSERVIYLGMAIFVVSLIFYINRWPGGKLLIGISFFYCVVSFILGFIQQLKGNKIELPNLNIPVILYGLIITLFVMVQSNKIEKNIKNRHDKTHKKEISNMRQKNQ